MAYSPYLRMLPGKQPLPALPYDLPKVNPPALAASGDLIVPEEVKEATGYRELLDLLERYAQEGLSALRAVNPRWNTAGGDGQIEELDQPMPRSLPDSY